MKLTKKVLSIILAAALVLGSVAVAATAAEVVTGLEGSVLTMNITSDKDVSDGKAEVKPGETITVSVAYTTNFYPGNAGVDLFVWTSGIFDDDATVATMVAADDYWEVLANFPLSSGYPTDYPKTSYTGYLNTRGELTDYVGQEIEVLDNEVFYTFTFTVPEDAEIGSVVDFVAPESKVYGGSGSTRGFIRQNVGDSSTYDVVASSYCETVNVDSLQITVVDEEEESTTPDVPDTPVVVDPVYGLEGSVLTMNVTSDKDVSDGKAEVKPGETITVSVDYTTNFYPGNAGVDLFVWTSGIFDDDATVATMVGADDYWEVLANFPLSSGYPTDYPKTSYTGYLNTRGELTDYVGQEIKLLSNEVFYTFKFTVPEDAEIGSVVDFVIPASKVYGGSGSTRGFIRQNVSDSSTYDVVASSYCETVNVDSLQITVVGDEEPPTEEPTTQEPVVEYADLTALQTAIAKAADAVTDGCTADSVAEFEAAKAAAIALNVEGTLASEQATINAAAQRLEDAIAGLTPIEYCDYAALEAAIAEYDGIVADKANYTTSSWSAYAEAYEAAVILYNAAKLEKSDENQTIIDNAAAALTNAKAALEEKADMTALQAAVDAEPSVAEEYATTDSWATYADALYRAEQILGEADDIGVSSSIIVEEATTNLINANNNLVEAPADYSAINDLVSEWNSIDKTIYTEESVFAVTDLMQNLYWGYGKSQQAEVDAYAAQIRAAIDNLELIILDYTKWNNAVSTIPGDLTVYKPASVAAYEAAKAEAETAYSAAVEALDQTALDAAADALTAAIALLEEQADKSALEAAISRASGLAQATYTPDSWAAADLTNVLAAANVVLADADASAEDVAAQVAAIEAAEAKLVVKADKSALADAIAAAQAKVEDDYTPTSWAAADLANVIAAAQAVAEDDNASAEEIAAQIEALSAATAKLVEKADKTALESAIEEATSVLNNPAIDRATEETLAALNEALAKAQEVYADEDATADEVATARNNLIAAIDGMVFYNYCDYAAYDQAVADAAALVEGDYTTSSWAAADVAAVVAANTVEAGLLDKDGNQDKINDAAQAINDAIAKLEMKADMSALQAAVDAEPTVAEEFATVDSWTTYAMAKSEAEAILDNADDTGVSAQDAVNAAAEALVNANNALVEETADYTAVDAAIASVPEDLSTYTQASVKALEKALDAVVEGLGKSKQDEVDAMAKAIEDAVAGLTVSEAAITNLEVDLSDYIKRGTKEYTFTVNGAPTKIQVINYAGGTATFDRYHRNATVVSYNANGEVIDYAEEAPAYEEWTVTLSLGEGEYKAKAKIGSQWEAFTYDFTVEFVDPSEDEVTFVAAPGDGSAEAGKSLALKKNAGAVMTVVVPNTVIKVQLAFSIGCTTTYTADMATVVDNGDGTSTWTLLRNFSNVGSYTMSLKLKDSAGWYDAVTESIAVEVTK